MMTTARFDKRRAGRPAAPRAKDDVAFRKPDLRFFAALGRAVFTQAALH